MLHALMLNVVGVIALAGLITFLCGQVNERSLVFMMAVWTLLCLSISGWVIYIAAHFVGKYW